MSALFGSFGGAERKLISAKAKGWIFMAEEKDSPVATQPKQETENEKQIYCNAVVRKYGNSFLGVLFEMYAQTRQNCGC